MHDTNLSFIKLSKYYILNEINMEFVSISNEVKRKLGITAKKAVLLPIILIYQNAFIFLLMLLLSKIQHTSLFLLIMSLFAVFNILLPISTARTEMNKMFYNPASFFLKLSKLSRERATIVMLISEIIHFWIHNFFFEVLTIWMFFIRFNFLGIFFSILWIIAVSMLYAFFLLKSNKLTFSKSSEKKYYFELFVGGFLYFNVLNIFLNSIRKMPVKRLFEANYMKDFLQKYLHNIYTAFVNTVTNYSIYVFLLFGVCFIFVFSKFQESEFRKFKTKIKMDEEKFQDKIAYFSKLNLFLKRDLAWIRKISNRLNINENYIDFPGGIVYLIITFIFFIINSENGISFLISLDFIFWAALSQSANYLVANIPILHVSSELKNVNLIFFSKKYTLRHLVKSKYYLLMILCSPLLFVILLEKILLAFLFKLGVAIFLISFFCSIITFVIGCFFSLRWTTISPSFNWLNIFMIRNDNFDSRIIQQFMVIPNRIISLTFCVSFSFVNCFVFKFSAVYIILYYCLSFLIMLLVWVIFSWRKHYEVHV